MSSPVAIVTGASSGIGLALTEYLLERQWNVVMADVNPPKEQLPNTLFIKTDISSWDQQSSLFSQAHAWQNRLDFVALNAGIDDRDDIFNTISQDPPKKPNLSTFDINLYGTYFGTKLAAHYLSLTSTSKTKPGGKIVITASAAGLYPLEVVPQYTASKHALIGLVRSLAPQSQPRNITINAVCPAMVHTNLPPSGLMENFSQEQITPMSTILRCFSELADLEKSVDGNWVQSGRNGDVVEGNLDRLIYHPAPERPQSSSYVNPKGMEAWAATYRERNIRWAKESQSKI
ncbi:Short-chain dehydrogenase/reductase ascJ [Pseudocercospora fuligena]|uniref:Short-chain dehydrogenase/reductase ascJ n=1 Tax=Pseudocercospora fuligena TaxID=685502 RepID=A0A8H6VD62_9PEZI|nr:Short-chain dehydrogenase/reductase ascJ [Pseudocercospora fuligena]